MRPALDLTRQAIVRCQHCNKLRGEHSAYTFNCPTGGRYRAGISRFSGTVFTPKMTQGKQP